jgi:thiamine biosynthesis lipoprotein
MNPINWLIFLSCSLLNFSSIDNPNLKLIIFEGSDWCVNCIQLEKNILSDVAFIEFSEGNEIEIERIDFPQRKKQDKEVEKYNADMAEKYDFDGTFPTVILLEKETNELIKVPSSKHKNTEDFLSFIQEKISSKE